jgi:hypothetical protein
MPDSETSRTSADRLRRDLREGDDALLNHRRGIVGLSIFSATVLGGIALFQIGTLKRLPNPPGAAFDADAVNASPEAYSHLDTPDALLGMANAALTACLAGAGACDRWRKTPWIPLVLAAKTAGWR